MRGIAISPLSYFYLTILVKLITAFGFKVIDLIWLSPEYMHLTPIINELFSQEEKKNIILNYYMVSFGYVIFFLNLSEHLLIEI